MSSNPYATYKAPSGGGGKYLKFEDGVAVKVRIVGEPVVFQSTYTSPQGEVNVSTRYAFQVHDRDANFGGPKIMQLPVTAFRIIQDLATNEEWGDPQQYDVTIKRTGTGTETKYTVQPSPKSPDLTDDEVEAVTAIDLKEAISASDFTSNVFYLSEATDAKPEAPKTNDVYKPEDGEPIDPSKIPF